MNGFCPLIPIEAKSVPVNSTHGSVRSFSKCFLICMGTFEWDAYKCFDVACLWVSYRMTLGRYQGNQS